MKKSSIYTILICLIFVSMSFAQGGKREKIKALKTAFITTELSLTQQEAEKFWPIYNAFEEKQFELRHEKMKSYMKRMDSDLDSMSEKEASSLLSQMESVEEETHQLRKKLVSDLKNVISSHKIIKLKKAEEDFNRNLLKQYRENRSSKRN
ncbi:MAG TPA: sensor of ECF-type sigma factor [Flavobacterium sp.]|uniref:sensor of ECF-type sigma factor n=1 Tax=unclassified Flavobacterium TaxID=196869 RepID=UPI0025C0C302|nr:MULTISPECIES: sensor of ECF-type sigma factor [unclassified Flavobacterium]HRE78034.1 sensor of ECF-type sigma factor [Flavobacterium sp.]